MKKKKKKNLKKKKKKKKNAVTWTRAHILWVDMPPSESLNHGDRCGLSIKYLHILKVANRE